MLKFNLNKNRVRGVSIEKPISDSSGLNNFHDLNHTDLSKKLQKEYNEFCSIIILKDRLDHNLMLNPNFCKTESFIGVSKIQEEARKRMINSYYNENEIEKIIKEQDYATKQYNYKKDTKKPSFLSNLKDSIFESQELALIPEIWEEYKNSVKYYYDEDLDKEIERTDDEAKMELDILKQELFLPQVFTTYNRVYSLPKPFNFWDDRNLFQQYYLVSNKEYTGCIQGGPASSHQREMHGLWAHTFAELSKVRNIQTFVLKYNSKNELHLLEHFDDFKAMNYDLTGNYRVNWSDTKHIFSGKLLNSDFSHDEGIQKISLEKPDSELSQSIA